MWVWGLLLQDPTKRGRGCKENTIWESMDAGGGREPEGEGGRHEIVRGFGGLKRGVVCCRTEETKVNSYYFSDLL